MQISEIQKGSRIKGLASETALIINVESYDESLIEVTFRTDDGMTSTAMIDPEQAEKLSAETESRWKFNGNPEGWKLAQEALRIQMSHLFDPFLAVHISDVEPLPHQITAVYQEMLSRIPLRYVLADDPGAGKTIMAGLLIKELMMRGDVRRCLIVPPGSLCTQWQAELSHKFGLNFEILTHERIESESKDNIFEKIPLCIARLDKLARSELLIEKLRESRWDLIICDEAHKMSASYWSGEIKPTKRYALGQVLSEITRHFLLLTATPHNGKERDFHLFMSLIDADRFGITHFDRDGEPEKIDVSDVMRRLLKEDLIKFDGTPLFPERKAYTVSFELSYAEHELYDAVSDYVKNEFNRARESEIGSKHRNMIGFALTVLQRRLASSPEAIYQSLKNRRIRLEKRLEEANARGNQALRWSVDYDEDYDEDEFAGEEQEQEENDIADQASASTTIPQLQTEIATLKRLESLASAIRNSGHDCKWEQVSQILQQGDCDLFSENGKNRKLIIFTEHRDTLNYLVNKIRTLFGYEDAVIEIHGGTSRQKREYAESQFKQDKNVRVLVATDAAGEGINLQCAHLMINYDLPWNPNRLEQRFGRIHRIGQTEVCHVWNLVAPETREGAVYNRLLDKISSESGALNGKVFDILGKVEFGNYKSLKDLLMDAVRYGEDPQVKARMNLIVDEAFDPKQIQALIDAHALTADVMDPDNLETIRENMEKMEARKMQPHYIGQFFRSALKKLGGRIQPRDTVDSASRYEIERTPKCLTQEVYLNSRVLPKYERVCFDHTEIHLDSRPDADLLCPGHPLLDAVIKEMLNRYRELLHQGTVFIDKTDEGTELRLLICLQDSVQDATFDSEGHAHVLSQQMRFIEISESNDIQMAGFAPYLDYDIPSEEDKTAVMNYSYQRGWPGSDMEQKAKVYVIKNILPEAKKDIIQKRKYQIDRIEQFVKKRLEEEIRYFDMRSIELKPTDSLNAMRFEQKADITNQRLTQRLKELELERRINQLPPVIQSVAMIAPSGLLKQLTHPSDPDSHAKEDTKTIECIAMQTVEKIERSLGYEPEDVSNQKIGYDIVSKIPKELRNASSHHLRFIEVKGRQAGADTITVTHNEVMCSLNCPEQFILAIVEIDGDKTHTTYIKQPFKSCDPSLTDGNYKIAKLKTNGEVIWEG